MASLPGYRYPLVLAAVAVTMLSDLSHAVRDHRFLNLFSVARFENVPCVASGAEGVCNLPTACTGSQRGTCGNGFGTCCIVEKSCRNTTSQKISYFTNPRFPDADSNDQLCDFRVDVTDRDVCQIRLDFEEFQTNGPEVNGTDAGTCDKSYLRLGGSPTDVSVPAITFCGRLTGQHLYAHLAPGRRDDVHLSMLVRLEREVAYKWRIKVTQIDCSQNSPLRAPGGCTQYYNGSTGMIESFNFPGNAYYLDQDYSICLNPPLDTCKTTFTSTEFKLSRVTATGTSGVGNGDCDAITGTMLRSDYLFIPGGSIDGGSPTMEKFCGGVLNYNSGRATPEAVVTRVKGPLVLRFRSDSIFDINDEKGFRIKYEASPTC